MDCTKSFDDRQQTESPLVVNIRAPQARTEAALSCRFQRDFGPRIKYVATWGKWVVWDEARWVLDHNCTIQELAQATAQGVWREHAEVAPKIEANELQAITAYAKTCNRKKVISDALEMCKPHVACSHERLDSDPWAINVLNGIVDLRTGKLRPHDRDEMHTKIAPVRFDRDAECPTWRKFIREIFDGDVDLINYIQTLVGYSLTGSITEHLIAILYGQGSNGKTVFEETLLKVQGEYGCKIKADMLLASHNEQHPTCFATLHGKRFVAAVEPDAGKRLNESVIKELTGGDSISTRRMREDFWTFTPTHTLWLACNHRPPVISADHGIWRRLKLIPFTRQWDTDGTRPDLPPADKDLPAKLEAELSGVFMWCLAGCVRYHAEGLTTPEVVSAASKAYRSDFDFVGNFIDEKCDVGPEFEIPARELFTAFSAYCLSVNAKPWTERTFGEEMERRHPKRRTREGNIREGIKLR